MSTYVKSKHDIGFLRQDGTTSVGLILAKDKNNNPIYRSYDDEFLSQQFASGTPGYENLPPEKELALVRSDWRGGYGQEYDDDESRYFYSLGADLRFKNMGILGPVIGSINPSTTRVFTTITNGNMEADSTWTGGAQSNTIAHGGTYSWKVNGAGGVDNDAYQDLTWDNAYKGKKFAFSVWVASLSTTACSIIIDDGVGTTTQAITTSTSWVLYTVNRTLDANATRLRIIMRGIAAEDFSFFDDMITTTLGTCTAMAKFNSVHYVGLGNALYYVTTGSVLTYVWTFPATITDLEVFGTSLYIALGYSYAYWYMSTNRVCTLSTLSNNTMKYFCTVQGTANTLWGSDTANTLRSTINPLNGGTAWSTQITVDSSIYTICELLTRNNVLYIRKQDKPYYLDSASVVKTLVTETEYMANSLEGTKSAVSGNDIFMQWGAQSLLRYETDVDTVEWLDPSDFITNASDFTGKVHAIAADERYVYAILDNDTKVEILAGRDEVVNGILSWRWHPIQEITLTGCEIAFVCDVYKKRLWITSTSASDSIYYIPLTTIYGNITGDTDYTYLTGGYFVTSWHHLNFKSDMKAFIKLTLNMASTSSTVYWSVSYQKLGDGTTWTTIGDFKTSPTTTKYIPVSGAGANPKSTMMRFKFTATTGSSASTPKLLSYDVRAVLYPSNRRLVECEVLCDNEIALIDGTNEKGQSPTIKAAIEEARAATYPIAFYDLGWASSGDTVYVKFLPTQSIVVAKEKTPNRIERRYKLTMQVVPLA